MKTDKSIDWLRSIPFILIHLAPLAAIWTEIKGWHFSLCGILYAVRMFFVTAGYHRYFTHQTYKTSRWFQFVLAIGSQMSVQKGILDWAGWHHWHHWFSDTPKDPHTPKHGILWSHMLWVMSFKHHSFVKQVKNCKPLECFMKLPELRWLNTWHWIPPVLLGTLVFAFGGISAFLIGFCLSTVLVWHLTFAVNSVGHTVGSRRYKLNDNSRNNWLLAFLTFGEGFQNNHHRFPWSVKQGLRWPEIDFTYYILKFLSAFRIVYDLNEPDQTLIKKTSPISTN